MPNESKKRKPLRAEKPKSSLAVWIAVATLGVGAVFGCVICGGVGAWFYVNSSASAGIEGVWEYSGRNLPPNVRTVRLMTGNQLVNVNYERNQKTMILFSGGSYTFQGTIYKERIEYCSPGIQEVLLDKEQSFRATIQANKMNVAGTLTNGNPINEDWQRIGTPTPGGRTPHEGPWQNTTAGLNPKSRSVKLIVGDQFMTILSDRGRKTTLLLSGGKCSLNGNAYTETTEYCSPGNLQKFLGRPQALTMQVQGDQMSVSGTVGAVKVDETWNRIK